MSVKRIKNLVKQLNEYRHAYYNQDAPLVSDAEYDRLFDELKELEERMRLEREERARQLSMFREEESDSFIK